VNAEHIDPEYLLVVTDDLALPLGQLRLRPKGGAGGHNGLSDIERALGHQQYARMRFGIDRKFKSGQQSDYVLGAWEAEDLSTVAFSKERAAEGALLWVFQGLSRAMNTVNVNPPNPEI
jgi:PTH1 family peptidyl-tRNA hydrolase